MTHVCYKEVIRPEKQKKFIRKLIDNYRFDNVIIDNLKDITIVVPRKNRDPLNIDIPTKDIKEVLNEYN